MAGTTAYGDGSGEVLIEEIAALNARIDVLRDELDAATARLANLTAFTTEAHAVFRERLETLERRTPADEDVARGYPDLWPATHLPGVLAERVAIVAKAWPLDLELAINDRLATIAAGGGTVTDIVLSVAITTQDTWYVVVIRFLAPEGV